MWAPYMSFVVNKFQHWSTFCSVHLIMVSHRSAKRDFVTDKLADSELSGTSPNFICFHLLFHLPTTSCLPIATSSTFTPFLSLFSVTFFLLLIMNPDQLNPTEMAALFQSFLNHMQSQPAATPTTQESVDAHFQSRTTENQLSTTTGSIAAGPPAQQGSNALPVSAGPPVAPTFLRIPATRPAQQGSSTTTPILRPYESSRTPMLPSAPYGHPSGHPPAGPSLQPFLGFNSIGVSTRGQVNQQRLAASASHQP
jgi:hypothetical protein